ncbi:adenine phosphoribosyltransferase [Tsukamurella paurometabola]|uniref:Adenine phosphoribosyltransferase n=1 Tax=Tsukamurella paurometabola TaxID=2061 RepID=A0A3P8K887_TSUPA|nr:adenine phosphoribosyltransferase [Tsukamurella paurometabola]UEA83838.1 adenine phosphoribosyltransferase [Tsukamurella paurometabola]VDR40984.1 Adenine phosphoribosyltransferase [Tsukamurella paurometabola]
MTDAARAAVAAHTRHVDGFPEPGVVFADLTPVFADGAALAAVIDGLAAAGRESGGAAGRESGGAAGRESGGAAGQAPDGAATVDLVAGLDARGFLLGSGVALRLGVGTLAVRKAGKLPPPVLREEYQLEYGSAALEIPAEGIALEGKRILIVDDVLATGGTVSAAVALLRRAGAIVERVSVVLELEALGGRGRLQELPGGPIAVSAISVG